MSTFSLGKATIKIEGLDACIKLEATKADLEIVDEVSDHYSMGSLVSDYEMLNSRRVILRCEFTEDMLISAGVSADPVKAKKMADLVRVIRLKK